jgi:hypothetical protein
MPKSRSFIHPDFLLGTPEARELYHEFAEGEPIYDYHCHLPPALIANNHEFADLAEIWLGGDHYKWRAMRSNGVNERFCTGDATPREKFQAWAETVPHTLRNPLYHWTHLELQRYFGVDVLLNGASAAKVWRQSNARLPSLRVHDLLARSKVAVVCTTDDPADSLEHHAKIRASGLKTRVYPAYRPDRALGVNAPKAFNAWLERLGGVAGGVIQTFDDLLSALKRRHDDFHAAGGRLSDHGLETALAEPCTHAEARRVFATARAGRVPSVEEQARYGSYLMLEFGRWDAARGWTKQLHLGALRSNNTRLLGRLGPDTGFDSIGDFPQALPRCAGCDGPAPAHDPLQRQPGGQLRPRNDDRQFSGRPHPRQAAVRQRLVVPRPEGGHGVADQRAFEPGTPQPLCRHADRLAQLPQLSPPRIFSARPLQCPRRRYGPRRDSARFQPGRRDGAEYLLRQRPRLLRARAGAGVSRWPIGAIPHRASGCGFGRTLPANRLSADSLREGLHPGAAWFALGPCRLLRAWRSSGPG